MSDANTPPGHSGSSVIGAHLDVATERLHAGDFAASIEAIKSAKSLEPKNIYVLAFEKQAEELIELERGGTLTDEQRTDIFDSIPSIVEKAIELSRTSSGVTNIATLGRPVQDFVKQSQEKAAALEWLKNQYFQHAHEYVRKGQYQNALAEVRRVYIIDSANAVAKELEKQIEQLAEIQGDPTQSQRMRVQTFSQGVAEAHPRVATGPAPVFDPAPAAAEHQAHTPDANRQAAKRAAKPAPTNPPRKSYSSQIIILLILIALGAVIMYFTMKTKANHPRTIDTLAPAAPAEEFIGAPTQAADQNVEYSTSGTDTTKAPELNPAPQDDQPKDEPTKLEERPGPKKKSGPNAAPAQVEAQPVKFTEPPPEPTQAIPDTATSVPFVAVEKEARIIRRAGVKLSHQLVDLGVSGRIVIRVQIDKTGKPVQTVTLQSTNDLLIEPVIQAVMESEYSPAEVTTGPIASWLNIPFNIKPMH
jgi:hypothetical protein